VSAVALATAVGILGYPDLPTALAGARPAALHIPEDTWERWRNTPTAGVAGIECAFENGRAFLAADDGLRGRPPRLIECTGGQRLIPDEPTAIDLRVDHVYLVSCRPPSEGMANTSPGRLFDGLLAAAGSRERKDWYATVAPAEYAALYVACRAASGLADLPTRPEVLTPDHKRRLRAALPAGSLPPEARRPYDALCRAVSRASAERWRKRLARAGADAMLCRLLRIGPAPYFVLGQARGRPVRLRVASAPEWRERFSSVSFEVVPATARQPQVNWTATYEDTATGSRGRLKGRIEIRWSHGRFAQAPEAKLHVTTPLHRLPGYFPLDAEGAGARTLPLG